MDRTGPDLAADRAPFFVMPGSDVSRQTSVRVLAVGLRLRSASQVGLRHVTVSYTHLDVYKRQVVEELIPEAHLGEHSNVGTLGVMAGFLVMMVLDVALG